MAQAIAPDAHVVYVDNDPVACSHGQALLGPRDRVGFVLGDLRRPAEILRHPEVLARIDFSRPVGVLCACALHFVPDEEKPHQIIAGYRDYLAPGSYLAITHGIAAAAPEDDPDGLVERVTDVYRNASAQIHVRPVKDIERFFDGFELIEPGVVWMARWRPDPGTRPAGRPNSLYGGVGCKPSPPSTGSCQPPTNSSSKASPTGGARNHPSPAGTPQRPLTSRKESTMINHDTRWSLPRGKTSVPSQWQATSLPGPGAVPHPPPVRAPCPG
jgi:hypothetical protein